MARETDTHSISVSDYASRIKSALRGAGEALVEGEVQSCRTFNRGVIGFDLTDGENKLQCRYLPWVAQQGSLSHSPSDGDVVRVQVQYPDYYAPFAQTTLAISDVTLAGEGELLKRRQALIEKFDREGMTNAAAFPQLPRFPRGVGVIAGLDSDALKDVLQGLNERFPAVRVFTACCQVQGAGAPSQIIDALARLDDHAHVDVIIVARGGGSVQDLATFDDEKLCRAIRAIDTPVVTAIGHTANNPVCNYVTHAAHVPRHAAERVVANRHELLVEIDHWSTTVSRRASERLAEQGRVADEYVLAARAAERLAAFEHSVLAARSTLDSRIQGFLGDARSVIGDAREALSLIPSRIEADLRECELALASHASLTREPIRRIERQARDLSTIKATFESSIGRALASWRTDMGRALDRLGRERSTASDRLQRRCAADVDGVAIDVAALAQIHGLRQRASIDALIAVLTASDFRRMGWSLVTTRSGERIDSVAAAEIGEDVAIHVADGALIARIQEIRPDEHE